MGMAAILINGPRPFVEIFNLPLTEDSTWNLKKIGPGVTEEKSFKGVDGRRRTESDHNSLSWALLRWAKNETISIEPVHDKTYKRICTTSDDSDQSAHPHSLIRVFVDRICLLQPPYYPKRDIREPLQYKADVQTDLSLCWSHMSFYRFCRAVALIWNYIRMGPTWRFVKFSSPWPKRSSFDDNENLPVCRSRSDSAERDVWSGSTLFALDMGNSMKHGYADKN